MDSYWYLRGPRGFGPVTWLWSQKNSFSGFQGLKTCLRSIMSQKHLAHLLLFNLNQTCQ